jgi:signal transduction histidine kinase
MIKSVFLKYMIAFLAIIAIGFTILGAIISSAILQNSYDAQRVSIPKFANLAKQDLEKSFSQSHFDKSEFEEFVKYSIDDLPDELSPYSDLTENSLIFVTDLSGKILVSTPLSPQFLQKDYVSDHIMYDILNQREIGKSQTLDGIFARQHYVFPHFLTTKSGEVYGVLFYCSESLADSFVYRMINTIILNCLWILVATMVVMYFITEKIVSPVREMSKAARSFALGKFDVRVPVKGSRDEIGELADAFNKMAASLAINEETQRTFVANVSHDLKTPMTSIAGYVDGILDGAIPPDKHEYYLRIVSTETRRLARFVTSLLDLSKMQAGERKFTKTKFDVCEMARQSIIFLGQKIEEKHIELEFDCDNDNIFVSADSVAIRQILDNLIDNAIKFTPEKGIIKVNIANSDDDKENEKDKKDKKEKKDKKVLVSVYNTGTGIPAEDIPFVFDRFYKSDRSRGLDKTGMGLGLFIVKTIIDAHEEKIWLESEYEKYCKFTFTLQKTNKTVIKQKL